MKVIYVDIDETICHRETSVDFGTVHDYTKAKPIIENIEKINKLYDGTLRSSQMNTPGQTAKTCTSNTA